MNILLLGANSDIAVALAREFVRNGASTITLASRNEEELQRNAKDLEVRGNATVETRVFNAREFGSHSSFYDQLDPRPDVVVLAFSILGDQVSGQKDFSHALEIIETNYVGAVSILEIAASDMSRRGSGTIIGIGSVAGERGRQSNYLYGSAKAGLNVYLSGLRNRLWPEGIHVMTVLPGFVDTKMTRGMDLPAKLMASPEEAASSIFRAYKKKKNIVYTKWFWRWIMLIIKSIPEPVFKRLKL